MPKVYLYPPTKSELRYRQEWMKDSKTMNYNAGFDLDLKGYDKKTGIISKTDEEMLEWYNKWIDKEPDRYFAYIYVEDIKEPIGEIYYYPDGNIHSMGILISDKYRKKGYSYPALLQLEEIAFEKNNISELSDMVPLDRLGALKTFKKAGFIYTAKEIVQNVFDKPIIVKQLLITKEIYLNRLNNSNNQL